VTWANAPAVHNEITEQTNLMYRVIMIFPPSFFFFQYASMKVKVAWNQMPDEDRGLAFKIWRGRSHVTASALRRRIRHGFHAPSLSRQ
jgi:hypothetical protein